MLNISKGKIARPQKVVIYGAEGIGKSSLAAQFPEPLFIDTEGGTAHMDVRRIDKPQSWEELLAIVKEVAATKDVCKTLVLDTADWAEQLVTTYLCTKYKQNSIESFGYGKGYTYLGEEFARLLGAFDTVLASGIHVVVTAHAKMRKFEQPDEMGAYDRWEMKLSKQVAPLLKEWCDLLLFCNYQTYIVTSESNAKKAQGGKRVMYTSHHPAWDAKNRVQLPEVLELDYKHIAHLFSPEQSATKQDAQHTDAPAPQTQPTTQPTLSQEVAPEDESAADILRGVLTEKGVTEAELRQVLKSRSREEANVPLDDFTPEFVFGYVIRYWEQITAIIEQNRDAKLVHGVGNAKG
ncbi:MAG: ATP-binding protein [Selenomonadaceae bacterium]|nr:ATP-binding protein [Selenomonadaceae bacterium]